MKKITLITLLTTATAFSFAQDGNNICTWNAFNTYQSGGGPEDLERGIECTNQAITNDATSGKSKTWYYRGELYTLVFMDKTLKPKYPQAWQEAIKAFQKLNEINDPKFRDWEDVMKYLLPLATTVFNEGVDNYQNKNYAGAFQYFYAIKDINAVVEARKQKPNIELTVALKNAAICAENSNNTEGAISVYKDWLAIAPEAIAYRSYAVALKRSGKKEESQKVIDEGLSKYPKDANLLVEKINVYLENAQYTEALTYVNNLLEVEPNNDGANFIKGLAYEKIGNEDSVIYYYTKSAELNPKSIKPWNNLGALYVNKANALVEAMNKLGNSSADIKKYDELKQERKQLYLKAKPYLEKAKEIEPNDPQILRTLKQVDVFTAE